MNTKLIIRFVNAVTQYSLRVTLLCIISLSHSLKAMKPAPSNGQTAVAAASFSPDTLIGNGKKSRSLWSHRQHTPSAQPTIEVVAAPLQLSTSAMPSFGLDGLLSSANNEIAELQMVKSNHILNLQSEYQADLAALDSALSNQAALERAAYEGRARLILLEAQKAAFEHSTLNQDGSKIISSPESEKLLKSAQFKIELLEQEYNEKVKHITANNEIQKSLRKTVLENKINEESRAAHKRSFEILTAAHNRAYTEAINLQKQFGVNSLDNNSTPNVRLTEPEKKILRDNFRQGTNFLRSIIIGGEANNDERKDIIEIMNSYDTRFDETLTRSDYINDQHYFDFSKQKSTIDSLVAAQKQADLFLKAAVEQAPVAESTQHKIRTLVLYGLNAKIMSQKCSSNDDKKIVSLDPRDISNVVNTVYNTIKNGLPEIEFHQLEAKKAIKERELAEEKLIKARADAEEEMKLLERKLKLKDREAAILKTLNAQNREKYHDAEERVLELEDAKEIAEERASDTLRRVQSLEGTLDDVQRKIRRTVDERDILAAEKKISIEKQVQLAAQVDQLSQDKATLQKKIDTSEQNKKELEDQCTQVRIKKNALLEEISDLEASMHSATQRAKDLEVDSDLQRSQRAATEEQIARLTAEHQAKVLAEQTLNGQLATLNQELVTTRGKMETLELESVRERELLQSAQATHEQDIASLTRELELLNNQATQTRIDLDSARLVNAQAADKQLHQALIINQLQEKAATAQELHQTAVAEQESQQESQEIVIRQFHEASLTAQQLHQDTLTQNRQDQIDAQKFQQATIVGLTLPTLATPDAEPTPAPVAAPDQPIIMPDQAPDPVAALEQQIMMPAQVPTEPAPIAQPAPETVLIDAATPELAQPQPEPAPIAQPVPATAPLAAVAPETAQSAQEMAPTTPPAPEILPQTPAPEAI